MSECQSPPGNMPAIWHVSFRVDSDGIRPLCQSRFGHLLVILDSYVVVFMYSDERDDTIIDNITHYQHPGLPVYPLPPRIQGPA